MTTRTLADLVSAHETLFATYVDWCSDFDAEELAHASRCAPNGTSAT